MQGTRKQNVSYKWAKLCSGKYFGKTYFVIQRSSDYRNMRNSTKHTLISMLWIPMLQSLFIEE